MKKALIISYAFITLAACYNSFSQEHKRAEDSLINKLENKIDTTEIICDSIYKKKGYKLIIEKLFDSHSYDENDFNAIFIFSKLINGKYEAIFKDSILSHDVNIKFEDFNNDKIKDILIENISDVRSNLTYYLYIIDLTHDKLKKVKGFNEIKNPNYLPEYNLIDNYVLSGSIWTSFYEIKNNKVIDYGITIYDDQKDDGKYERDYKKAINKIIAKKKK
ncbi:MAG: hypothetical protein QM764_02500 [Chitinophagaceae bacterium]